MLEWVQLADERIPVPWTDGSLAWHDLLSRAHSYPEAIHLLEGKALLRSVEILVKLPWTRDSRCLCLEDNQTVVGAWSKGRSSSWSLNQLLRRRAALELTSAVEVLLSWIGTQRMPLDRLSRERVTRRTEV